MKEPVHHHQQDRDRQQPGRGLEVEAAGTDGVRDRDRDEPGRHRGGERGRRAERERLAVGPVGAAHARCQDGQHEDRLEPLAQHEDAAVEHDREVAQVRVRVGRIRRPTGRARELPREQPYEYSDRRNPADLFTRDAGH